MALLSVNLNKVALVRNARGGSVPDVVGLGRRALELSVGGITVHPRPDQRHIRPHDVFALAELVQEFRREQSDGTEIELNIEGNPLTGIEFTDLVAKSRPQQVTLVPDSTDQLTSDAGWALDDPQACTELEKLATTFEKLGSRVCVFVEPLDRHIVRAAECGVDGIELYTQSWVEAHARGEGEALLADYCSAASTAKEQGLRVNAGHDLSLANLGDFRLPYLDEVSIGHALFCDALDMGWDAAVSAYNNLVREL